MALVEYAAEYRREQLLREAQAERLARLGRGVAGRRHAPRWRSMPRRAAIAAQGQGRRAAAAVRRLACAVAPGPARSVLAVGGLCCDCREVA
jgi:hypothetical protein